MNKFTRFSVGTALLVAAGSSFAAVDPAITTAITNAQASTATIATGVITIAAVMMGLGLIVAWLRK